MRLWFQKYGGREQTYFQSKDGLLQRSISGPVDKKNSIFRKHFCSSEMQNLHMQKNCIKIQILFGNKNYLEIPFCLDSKMIKITLKVAEDLYKNIIYLMQECKLVSTYLHFFLEFIVDQRNPPKQINECKKQNSNFKTCKNIYFVKIHIKISNIKTYFKILFS